MGNLYEVWREEQKDDRNQVTKTCWSVFKQIPPDMKYEKVIDFPLAKEARSFAKHKNEEANTEVNINKESQWLPRKNFYLNDPRWVTVKYPKACSDCGEMIEKGEKAFYYPKGKNIFCEKNGCGEEAQADFRSSIEYEENITGSYISKQGGSNMDEKKLAEIVKEAVGEVMGDIELEALKDSFPPINESEASLEKTARLVSVHCKKCGEDFKLDIGDKSQEEVEKMLELQKDGFECPGHHVELDSPINYWEIDWESAEEGKAPTDEEFLADLKSKYDEVYGTDELKDANIEITSFVFGIPMAKDSITGKDINLDFTSAPSGKRYYYVISRG